MQSLVTKRTPFSHASPLARGTTSLRMTVCPRYVARSLPHPHSTCTRSAHTASSSASYGDIATQTASTSGTCARERDGQAKHRSKTVVNSLREKQTRKKTFRPPVRPSIRLSVIESVRQKVYSGMPSGEAATPLLLGRNTRRTTTHDMLTAMQQCAVPQHMTCLLPCDGVTHS
jgi:hypothetical protein